MKRIHTIYIQNLRSIKEENFSLSHFTPLVGVNNSGKSAILRACEWITGEKDLLERDWRAGSREIVVSVFGQDSQHIMTKSQKLDQEPRYFSDTKRVEEATVQEMQNFRSGFAFPIVIDSLDTRSDDSVESIIRKVLREIFVSTDGVCSIDGNTVAKKKQIQSINEQLNLIVQKYLPCFDRQLEILVPDSCELHDQKLLTIDGENITTLGNGSIRSIQMALLESLLVLHQSKSMSHKKATRLLLIDEPEIYMHPSGIERARTVLKKLSEYGYQVVFSTHSAAMVKAEDVSRSLLIRRNTERGTYCRERFIDAIRNLERSAKSQLQLIFSLGNASQVLFSEKAILVEGKTELRILPTIYATVTGKTLGESGVALVNQDSSSSTKKSMRVLRAMDIPCKAIVDIDYVFNHGRQAGIVRSSDVDVLACKKMFQEMKKDGICNLDDNGLPTSKNSPISSSDAYHSLTLNPKAKKHIDSLFQKALRRNIWIWRMGDIEKHLGVPGKSEYIWQRVISGLESGDIKSLHDGKGFKELIQWIEGMT